MSITNVLGPYSYCLWKQFVIRNCAVECFYTIWVTALLVIYTECLVKWMYVSFRPVTGLHRVYLKRIYLVEKVFMSICVWRRRTGTLRILAPASHHAWFWLWEKKKLLWLTSWLLRLYVLLVHVISMSCNFFHLEWSIKVRNKITLIVFFTFHSGGNCNFLLVYRANTCTYFGQ